MRYHLGLLLLALVVSYPAYGHMACRDVLNIERNYGKPHTNVVVMVSLSSYVTGYVSGLGVLGDILTKTARADDISSREIDWITTGINQTRIQAFKRLFFQTGVGASLYNEDNYKLAAQLVVDQCHANPQDTAINLFEEKVIDLLISSQSQ